MNIRLLVATAVGSSWAWPDSSVRQLAMNGTHPSDVIAINGTFADKDGCSEDGKLVRFTYNGLDVWSVDIKRPYLHDPVFAADGTVYLWANCGEQLRAIGPDGLLKWKMDTSREDSAKKHPPVVGPDGTVYVVSGFGSLQSYLLVALSSFNGLKLWQYELPLYSGAVPVIAADGTVIVNAGGILSGIKPDGTESWSFNVSASDSSEPAVAPDGTVYICSDAYILAIDPTRAPVPSQENMIKWKMDTFRTPSCVDQTWGTKPPFIDQNGDVYWFGAMGSGWTDRLIKIGPGGEIAWAAETTKFGQYVVGNLSGPLPCAPFRPVVGGSAKKPFILASYYYNGDPDSIQLLAFNATDGTLNWHSDHNLRSKPSVAGSSVVAYFERPNVYLGQVTGFSAQLEGYDPKFVVREQWFYPSPRSSSCHNAEWSLCSDASEKSGNATECNSRDACIWAAYDKACVPCGLMPAQCTVEDVHHCAGREQSSCEADDKCFWGKANVMTCISKCSPIYHPTSNVVV